jgi:hypothetical protein
VAWALVTSGAAAACTGLSSPDDPIAIEFVAPPASIAVADTVVLHIRVLSRSGDTIPGAPIGLLSLVDSVLTVDSALRAVIGVQAGAGRIVASSGNIISDPLAITVTTP